MESMSTAAKTVWTKIKDGFDPAKRTTKPTTAPAAPAAAAPYVSTTYTFDGNAIVEVDNRDPSVHVKPQSLLPQRPIFTIAVGVVDLILLIVMYIVQRGRVLSTNTWIKMGGKYVPCMKPLATKAQRELYNAGLKSQCYAFLFPFQFYRFFTPMFLHGGFSHLLNNLVYQTLVGYLLERKYGTRTFAICYILFGFSGNIMSALCKPKTVSVGASGAVYGLLFFCIIDNTLRIFTITNVQDKIIQFLVMLLVVPYFVMSVFVDVDLSGRVDHWAHAGGALMGILVAIFMCDMPRFITEKITDGERRIGLIALIAIIGYFCLSLLIFYLKPTTL